MRAHWAAWLPIAVASAICFGQESANAQEVKVDLQPCIIVKEAIVSTIHKRRGWLHHVHIAVHA